MNEELLPWVALVGERTGRVKDLSGYRKPSIGSSRKGLAGLGAEEVTKAGEEMFAAIRPALRYKRKDLAFSREGASGVLMARDFDLTIELLPHSEDEDGFVLRKRLGNIKSADLFERPEFNEVFGGVFQRLELRSQMPVQVEEWIDRIEDRDLEEEWQLQYPADYTHCSMRLPGSEFQIKVTPECLVMTRLLPGTPQEFWEGLNKLGPVLQPA